ncbi:acyltransferase (plasmid) [Pedobacter sp. BS3]|uniref:acyltransferase n=1 Tax=Pedobacter sp. BS3 TaxID=2567937 RepID=UPI0011ECBAD1|nr:acyltransferase [Pedobacter sp. BS3]TZF86196.1 acyltransferase [Pedobacter sp. BS3]
MPVVLFLSFFLKCKKASSNFIKTFIYRTYYRLKKKNIIPHSGTFIKGIDNINLNGRLEIGFLENGFGLSSDKSFFNIRGKLIIAGNYSVGKGCRLDIGPNAVVTIGKGGYINNNCLFVIMNKLIIGENTIISWNCQFLDEDFHHITYEGQSQKESGIHIGNNVWIGCNVKIYRGVTIPDGCVIAADSVVKSSFTETSLLISGFPAKAVKRNVTWHV